MPLLLLFNMTFSMFWSFLQSLLCEHVGSWTVVVGEQGETFKLTKGLNKEGGWLSLEETLDLPM